MKGRALIVIAAFVALLALDWSGVGVSGPLGVGSSHPAQEPAQGPSYRSLLEGFRNPPSEYGQIDCWWWEAGRLNKDKMRWELEQLKDKGVAGTWLYPRYVWGEPLGSDPGYWTYAWWDLIRYTMQENQRLGLVSFYSDWTTHQFIQGKIRLEQKTTPTLTGHRLAIHEKESNGPGALEISIPDDEEILSVAAFKKSGDGLDYASRKELRGALTGHKLIWSAPAAGWLVTAVVTRNTRNSIHDAEN